MTLTEDGLPSDVSRSQAIVQGKTHTVMLGKGSLESPSTTAEVSFEEQILKASADHSESVNL